ncbi:pyridoxamine 5'-phosphate oxidase family protein [Pelagicoccus sp. SDUM812002]|uniref:pyridoxamine 5'-phosphate oxidase family protein n=1 Tax=Pelagicoccus sp. SDUM812002 TaxID=3041266 RepID=UPI0028104A30|nr:pyridoxamine 5'-phosphate oxidase family protein [Pelagicoccus sp. SDUM812002]MDQ8184581.1 pyridoxamine 5'-phosphate oxidase family protein [Pelagicoccus sp. SDUM812002]
MARKFMEIALTPSVQHTQETYYGRRQQVESGPDSDALGENEQSFIAGRNSFYMASVNEDGWPYIQHRGGPEGFLKVISPSQIAFADYKGNRQLISAGNLSLHSRVSLFLMDYPSRTRLKILGTAQVQKISEAPQEILNKIGNTSLGRTERVFVIDIVSYDWNCPQYITPRYSQEEMSPIIEGLKQRIHELENV